MSVLLGPILQFRGTDKTVYSLSALVVQPLGDPEPGVTPPSGVKASMPLALADIPLLAPKQRVWRVDFSARQGAAM